MNGQRILGLVLILAGGVLAFGFPDLKFFWFEGRPLGIVLAILGVLDLLESLRRKPTTSVSG